MQDGRHADALEKYLYCFTHGASDRGYAKTRQSSLFSELQMLVHFYPPAADALREQRNLTRVLDDQEFAVRFFDKLLTIKGAEALEVRQTLLMDVCETLLTKKRYQDVLDTVPQPVAVLEYTLKDVTAELQFLEGRSKAKIVEVKRRFVGVWAQIYGALLGGGRANDAERLASRLIDWDDSRETFLELQRRAQSAENKAGMEWVKKTAAGHGRELN